MLLSESIVLLVSVCVSVIPTTAPVGAPVRLPIVIAPSCWVTLDDDILVSANVPDVTSTVEWLCELAAFPSIWSCTFDVTELMNWNSEFVTVPSANFVTSIAAVPLTSAFTITPAAKVGLG